MDSFMDLKNWKLGRYRQRMIWLYPCLCLLQRFGSAVQGRTRAVVYTLKITASYFMIQITEYLSNLAKLMLRKARSTNQKAASRIIVAAP